MCVVFYTDFISFYSSESSSILLETKMKLTQQFREIYVEIQNNLYVL